MTRVLKFLTVGIWILIFIIWLGVMFFGIPAEVSDEVAQGVIEPTKSDIEKVIQTRRTWSALILIPALAVFGLIIYSIRKRKHRLFYIGMTITIIPILTLGGLGWVKESEMPYKDPILGLVCLILAIGLIIGLKEIFKTRNLTLRK